MIRLSEFAARYFACRAVSRFYREKVTRRAALLEAHTGGGTILVPYPVCRRIFRPALPALLIDCYSDGEARLILAAAERYYDARLGGDGDAARAMRKVCRAGVRMRGPVA